MIIEITTPCTCGNKDVSKFKEYDGFVGYEAIVCLVCGRYGDHDQANIEADEWSIDFVKRNGGFVK